MKKIDFFDNIYGALLIFQATTYSESDASETDSPETKSGKGQLGGKDLCRELVLCITENQIKLQTNDYTTLHKMLGEYGLLTATNAIDLDKLKKLPVIQSSALAKHLLNCLINSNYEKNFMAYAIQRSLETKTVSETPFFEPSIIDFLRKNHPLYAQWPLFYVLRLYNVNSTILQNTMEYHEKSIQDKLHTLNYVDDQSIRTVLLQNDQELRLQGRDKETFLYCVASFILLGMLNSNAIDSLIPQELILDCDNKKEYFIAELQKYLNAIQKEYPDPEERTKVLQAIYQPKITIQNNNIAALQALYHGGKKFSNKNFNDVDTFLYVHILIGAMLVQELDVLKNFKRFQELKKFEAMEKEITTLKIEKQALTTIIESIKENLPPEEGIKIHEAQQDIKEQVEQYEKKRDREKLSQALSSNSPSTSPPYKKEATHKTTPLLFKSEEQLEPEGQLELEQKTDPKSKRRLNFNGSGK